MKDTIDTALTTPEISPERQAAFVMRDESRTYGLFCGDDRNPTDESSQTLESLDIDGEAFWRYFGGLYGVSRVAAVSMAVQYGPEVLTRYGGSFSDFSAETKERVERTTPGIKLGAHSAEDNEHDPAKMNDQSDKGIGCAYCGSIGAVSCLCQPETELTELAHEEQSQLLGDDHLVDQVTAANEAFVSHFIPEQPEAFGLGRSDFSAHQLPVMILAGSHGKAKDVVVVQNFHADKISRPARANQTGVAFYDNDVTAVAEMIMRAYPELKLQPKILFAVMDHDIRATRAALAAHEDLGAEALKVERYGDPAQALDYLESLR